jgi:hypothetical protein
MQPAAARHWDTPTRYGPGTVRTSPAPRQPHRSKATSRRTHNDSRRGTPCGRADEPGHRLNLPALSEMPARAPLHRSQPLPRQPRRLQLHQPPQPHTRERPALPQRLGCIQSPPRGDRVQVVPEPPEEPTEPQRVCIGRNGVPHPALRSALDQLLANGRSQPGRIRLDAAPNVAWQVLPPQPGGQLAQRNDPAGPQRQHDQQRTHPCDRRYQRLAVQRYLQTAQHVRAQPRRVSIGAHSHHPSSDRDRLNANIIQAGESARECTGPRPCTHLVSPLAVSAMECQILRAERSHPSDAVTAM